MQSVPQTGSRDYFCSIRGDMITQVHEVEKQ